GVTKWAILIFMAEITLQALESDRTSGSSELLRRTIEIIRWQLAKGTQPDALQKELEQLCRNHPAMALLQSFSRFFQKIPLNERRIQAWLEMYDKHEASSCRFFASHLSNFKNILVHSGSGMLLRAFQLLQEPVNIFCTESRPMLEGKLMAER